MWGGGILCCLLSYQPCPGGVILGTINTDVSVWRKCVTSGIGVDGLGKGSYQICVIDLGNYLRKLS